MKLIPTKVDDALFLIIKTIQRSDFSSEINQLQKNQEVGKKALCPFIDGSDILQVGRRLEASLL